MLLCLAMCYLNIVHDQWTEGGVIGFPWVLARLPAEAERR